MTKAYQPTKNITNLTAIVRTFQAGAVFDCQSYMAEEWSYPNGIKNPSQFDAKKFETEVVKPVRALLEGTSEDDLRQILVYSCGDSTCKWGEEVNALGDTPSTQALRIEFEEEIASGRIVPAVVTSGWGLNAGSVTPLNLGVIRARDAGASHVLMWSPEIALNANRLQEMRTHVTTQGLPVVGYLREGFDQQLSWQVVQNTIALWDVGLLTRIGGFRPGCNGVAGATTWIAYQDEKNEPKKEQKLIAGMDDFDAYVRACKLLGLAQGKPYVCIPWGMVGRKDAISWKTPDRPSRENKEKSVFEKEVEKYIQHQQKVARQDKVMDIYAQLHLGISFDNFWPEMSAACKTA